MQRRPGTDVAVPRSPHPPLIVPNSSTRAAMDWVMIPRNVLEALIRQE